jgi:sugar lactone lactonase YvrE
MKKLITLLAIVVCLNANAQIITTVAGGGNCGYLFCGDGGQATAALLNNPSTTTFDTKGNMYIADYLNYRIRKVNTAGIINTLAGKGTRGYSGDNGPATVAEFGGPTGVAVDAIGNVYIADYEENVVRKVNTAGIISTFAGTGFGVGTTCTTCYSGDGGQATAARLNQPWGVAVDAVGNVYISDQTNNCIRQVNTNGIITTFAGNGIAGYSGDGGVATNAEIDYPCGLVCDAKGNLYITNSNHSVIRMISTSGIITTIAGTGVQGYSGDGGQATAAELFEPYDVAVDTIGNIYIADYYNYRIRVVNTVGIISTFAGNGIRSGGLGNYGDNGPATAAELFAPWGVSVDAIGNVYITDQAGFIRKVDIGKTQDINQYTESNNINVYPNPANTIINIKLRIQDESTSLYLTDILGNTVKQYLISNLEFSIDVADLSSGVYFIKTTQGTKKFIKQ